MVLVEEASARLPYDCASIARSFILAFFFVFENTKDLWKELSKNELETFFLKIHSLASIS